MKIISTFNVMRWIAVFAVVGILTVMTASLALAEDLVRLEAQLSGPAIKRLVPDGKAEWRLDENNVDKRISVQVGHVKLQDGTRLSVAACGSNIGVIILSGQGGNLDLDTRDGEAVPNCKAGDSVIVSRGTTTIVSGTFQLRQ